MAALSNMSAYFKNLPAIVCQRLVALLEALWRRHQRLVQSMHTGLRLDAEQTHAWLNAVTVAFISTIYKPKIMRNVLNA
ncbi:MAG: hypothetical protein CUN54_10700 [Phototrophicales bacterium]|nr:MAG: hypothetical protein CUN54_10700 [Phototrophicales bacterium]